MNNHIADMQDYNSNVKAAQQVTILQVVPRLQSGGAEQSTCEIAAGIVAAGGRSLVASAGGRLETRLKREGSTHLTMPADSKNPLRMALNVVSLCMIIRANAVSLIHARSRAPAWSAIAAARLCGIPFVTTYHGAHAPAGTLKTAYNSIMARGDVTIANSHFTAQRIQELHSIDEQRLAVIHRGVDLDVYDPALVDETRESALREAWQVHAGDRLILLPGRLSARKGHDTAVRAMALLSSHNLAPICIFAGDDRDGGQYGGNLQHLAAQLGIAQQIRLAGHCADMPAAYALSEITLIASTEPEAFGRTAPEAQAMGSLVIATDLGGAVETVLTPPDVPEDRRTGWRVPPGDDVALADALAHVLALPAHEKDRVNQLARQRVGETFSLSGMVFRTLQVYDRLLGSSLATQYMRHIQSD